MQAGRRNLPGHLVLVAAGWAGNVAAWCRQRAVLVMGSLGHGVAGRDTVLENLLQSGDRDCQGEQGASSLVLRMLKRKTFCKDLEGTVKSLLRFKHPEEASGLRARLEKRLCLQGHSGTGEG